MRVFTILKRMAQKLGLIGDYVVETGKSGIWTYQKWASGVAECWTANESSMSGTATTNSTVGGYYSYASCALPTGLFSSPPAAVANAYLGTGISGGVRTSCQKNEMTLFVVGGQADRNIHFTARVSGRWK